MSVARILGKPREEKLFVPDPRWVLPTNLLGLEYEYEGVEDRTLPNHTHAALWTYHEEGSLRDDGAEYVFTQPLFGKDAYNAIDWLMTHAADQKWKPTMRTGIHVHIDMRDIEVVQLVGMALIYTIVEPILYRWIGDNRENSHFCVPLYKADEALIAASGIIANALADDKNDRHSTVESAGAFERYSGLNFQALQKFGSFEFRHMRTTHDKARVYNWVNIIMALKEASFRVPTSDGAIVRMAERMGASEFLHYVFGPTLAALLWTHHSQGELVELGIPTARDLALHGCNEDKWGSTLYPKGVHKGFLKFMESPNPENKEASKKALWEGIRVGGGAVGFGEVMGEYRMPEGLNQIFNNAVPAPGPVQAPAAAPRVRGQGVNLAERVAMEDRLRRAGAQLNAPQFRRPARPR